MKNKTAEQKFKINYRIQRRTEKLCWNDKTIKNSNSKNETRNNVEIMSLSSSAIANSAQNDSVNEYIQIIKEARTKLKSMKAAKQQQLK